MARDGAESQGRKHACSDCHAQWRGVVDPPRGGSAAVRCQETARPRRSLGRSARILKSETQGLHEDGTVEGQAAASSPAAIPAAPEARAAVPVTPEVDQNAADTLAANPVPEVAEGQTKPTAS